MCVITPNNSINRGSLRASFKSVGRPGPCP